MSAKQVAVIGLGNMGLHMASNLVKKGFSVRGYDISGKAMDALQKTGASVLGSPLDSADSDVVITMLPSNQTVMDTYLHPTNGILNGLAPGTVCIDSSTVSPSVARQVFEHAEKQSKVFVDAPVSGGVNGAKAGTLTFMVVSGWAVG